MEPTVSKRAQLIVTILLVLVLISIIGVYIYIGMQATQPVMDTEAVETHVVDETSETSTRDRVPAITETELKNEVPSALSVEERNEIIEQLDMESDTDVVSEQALTSEERAAVVNQLFNPNPVSGEQTEPVVE